MQDLVVQLVEMSRGLLTAVDLGEYNNFVSSKGAGGVYPAPLLLTELNEKAVSQTIKAGKVCDGGEASKLEKEASAKVQPYPIYGDLMLLV